MPKEGEGLLRKKNNGDNYSLTDDGLKLFKAKCKLKKLKEVEEPIFSTSSNSPSPLLAAKQILAAKQSLFHSVPTTTSTTTATPSPTPATSTSATSTPAAR